MDSVPLRGWDAVTVPGAVSAWMTLSERYGKLPFEALFEPAIRYAREGYLVSPITAKAWSVAPKVFGDFPEFAAKFLPNGRAPRAGELFRYEDQAKTLERIAETKGEAFYRGDLAQKIAAHAKESDALLTEEDLAEHQADWVDLISEDYRECDAARNPP